MKKRFTKILTLAMSSIMAVGTLFGCATEQTGRTVSATLPEGYYFPEYTIEQSGKTYESFAYGASRNEYLTFDGEKRYFADTTSVEYMQTYKDAGFTVYFSTFSESADIMRVLDNAEKVGLKVLITDFWILDAVGTDGKLVDENNDGTKYRDYRTEEELQAAVKEQLEEWCSHPAFFGLNMRDEPVIDFHEDYGDLYKAIRAVEPTLKKADGTFYKPGELYLHVNMLPLGINTGTEYYKDYETLGEAYDKYVRNMFEVSDADRLSVDIYEFRRDGVFPGFFPTMQMFANACRDYNAGFTYVQQSFNTFSGTTESYGRVTRAEMMSETYTAIGLGATHFSYYTYSPYDNQSVLGTHTIHHFLDFSGKPTNVYYYGQAAMKEAKFLADYVYNYDYLGCNFVTNPDPDSMTFGIGAYLTSRGDSVTGTSAQFDRTYKFEKIKNEDIVIDNDILLVSELKDSKNDLYMYMFQNVLNPSDEKIGRVDVNVSVDFGTEYDWVAEIGNGMVNYVKLDKGVYTASLGAGYANFVVPLAKAN